jgi:hypothetical protein
MLLSCTNLRRSTHDSENAVLREQLPTIENVYDPHLRSRAKESAKVILTSKVYRGTCLCEGYNPTKATG